MKHNRFKYHELAYNAFLIIYGCKHIFLKKLILSAITQVGT